MKRDAEIRKSKPEGACPAPAMLPRTRNRARVALWGILAGYAALAVIAALTYAPRADEGFFASPGLNLATKGYMGTTVVEGSHKFLKDIHRYTYWITPLHFVVQAGWYKVAGFGLFRMRMLSLLFGLLALAVWYAIAARVSGSRTVAALASALIAFDFNFVAGGASGRMDMMAAALNFSGIAAYLALRERSVTAAVLAGNALAAAAGLTHPVAGYLAFLAQALVLLYFDRARISPRLIAVAAAPYLIGGAAWGSYILKDPEAFVAQFGTNATMSGRLNGLHAPWVGIWHELTLRYAGGYGLRGQSTGVSGPAFLKVSMLFLYAAGLAGAVLTREIRANKGYRALLLLLLAYFLALSVLDAQKAFYYLPHVTPFYAALAAAWIASFVRTRRVPLWAPAAAVSCTLLIQSGGVVYRGCLNPFARTYAPAMDFLRARVSPEDTLFGSASAAFSLGFDRGLVDDVRLGFYTGRKPDFILVDEEYRIAFGQYEENDPKVYAFIARRLAAEYVPVYDRDGYTVLISRDRLSRSSEHPIANAARIR